MRQLTEPRATRSHVGTWQNCHRRKALSACNVFRKHQLLRSSALVVNCSESSYTKTVPDEVLKHKHVMKLFNSGQQEQAIQLIEEHREQFPNNVIICTSAAVMQGKMGRIVQSRKLFQSALEINPDCVPAMHAWGSMEVSIGNVKKGMDLFQKAIEIDPSHLPSLQSCARYRMLKLQFKEARELLQRVLQINPRHAPSLHALAKLEVECGNEKAACDILDKLLELEPANVRAITTLGKISWMKGDCDKARSIFSVVIKSSDDCAKAAVYSFWAGLEARAKNVDFARMKLQQALSHQPRHISSLITLATLEARAGYTDRANNLYQRALQVDASNPYVSNAFAQFLRQLGRMDEAKNVLERFLKYSSCGVSWHILGELHVQDGMRDQARYCFEQGIRSQHPKGAMLCIEGLTDLEVFDGSIENARRLFQSGEKQYIPTARYYRKWAILEKREGNSAESRKLFEMAHKRNRSDTKTLLHWGLLEKKCGDEVQAAKLFKKGIRIDSKNAYIWYAYITMLISSGHISEARKLMKHASRACPEDGPLLLESAMLEWTLGETEKAREIFQRGSLASYKSVHYPLLEAWLLMETKLNNTQVVDKIKQQMQELRPKNKET